jgi:hypothetical protein
VCNVSSLLHAHTQQKSENANANSHEHISAAASSPSDDRASAPAIPPSSRAVHGPSFGMTPGPGPAETWSGPVETDFQGRLRFSSGNRPDRHG